MAGYFVLACRVLIGIVFAASAVTKLRSKSEYLAFSRWLGRLPLPRPVRGAPAAAAVTVTETAIVFLLVPAVTAAAGLIVATLTLTAFAAGTFLAVRRGAAVPCRCFGASDSPMSNGHVARDLALAVLAAIAAATLAMAGQAVAALPAGGAALSVAIAMTAAVPVVLFDDLLSVFRIPVPR